MKSLWRAFSLRKARNPSTERSPLKSTTSFEPALNNLMVGNPSMVKPTPGGKSFSVASILAMTILSVDESFIPNFS